MHELEELVGQVRRHSFDGDRRRYYTFRYSSHDSAAVADCVGSNLRCAHEWGWCEGVLGEPDTGTLYTPEEVAERLKAIVSREGTSHIRFSGMEPIMRDDHLITVIDHIDVPVRIDTNGIMLDASYAERLATRDVTVRLSFKGYDEESFSKLARVEDGFERQIRALEAAYSCDILEKAVLAGVFDVGNAEDLQARIEQRTGIDLSLSVEKLRLCPENEKRLRAAGFAPTDLVG